MQIACYVLATSFCHIDSYVVRDAVNVEAISPCFAWYGQCRRRTRGRISISNHLSDMVILTC